ncbi:MAG: AI-2E family transporter [Mariprofundaceae bacterium]|nr:AI-2E family transporter [Mariprofundaceae bacterium]
MRQHSPLLLSLACLMIVIAGIQAAASVLIPLLLSLFMACICLPPLRFLLDKGVSSAWAIALVMIGLVVLGLFIATFAGASVADFSQNLPTYQSRLKLQMMDLLQTLNHWGLHLSNESILAALDPSVAMGFAGKLLAGFGNVLANTFFIILTVIFLLSEAISLPHKWKYLGEHAPKTTVVQPFLDSVNQYLLIKTVVSLVTGTLVALGLSVLGVDYPILWGLLAFLLNYVPNIGSMIAAIPAVLLAWIQLGGEGAIYTVVLYTVINIVMGSVVEPRFLGKGVGLSTLVVFLSLVFWGWLLGSVGMLLSVPLTMIVKLALEANEKTQWLAVILGPDIPVAVDAVKHKESLQ